MSIDKWRPKAWLWLFFVISLVTVLKSEAQTSRDFEPIFLTAQNWNEADWAELLNIDDVVHTFGCRKANARQIAQVNDGNLKLQRFLSQCASATNNSRWCSQLTRPNPASVSIFRCTYGEQQPHQLIPPDEGSWKNAFQAVRLIEQLESEGIKPCLIYNWWRPEPFNANVGGAPGRHPFATSVDVRFCSINDMGHAFLKLCRWRAEGKLRALGYYGSTGLHFGIGDKAANTWGKSCPRSLEVESEVDTP